MKFSKIILSALITCLVTASAFAQTPDAWEPKQGKLNNAVTAVAATPANGEMAVVGYDNGDVYLTLTNGTSQNPSWIKVDDPAQGTPLPNKGITSIAISPYDTKTYFVAFGGCKYYGNLWVTRTGGQYWQELESAPFCNIVNVSINPKDPSIIYVTEDGGQVSTSEDYGNNWTTDEIVDPLKPAAASGKISAVATAQGSRDRVLVGTDTGEIWMTYNAQDSNPGWTILTDVYPQPDFPSATVSDLVWDDNYAPAMFYAVFNSAFTGKSLWKNGRAGNPYSWTTTQNDAIPSHTSAANISLNPAFVHTLYVTTTYTEYEAYQSNNNGSMWYNGDCATTTANSFDTTSAVCFAIDADEVLNGWGAWNVDDRIITVNGVQVAPGAALPAAVNDTYFFEFSAGSASWAGFDVW
ncbi:MAG: hypothetical protein JXR76_19320 [Deltaproteobacteria bacterium]|nr:hypothetical protein [Deltaproteobacteria bacterium]